ncbi:IS3 family transposase [Shewanella sp. 10N.286.52.B9]|uniref:IS3 family transposase n=1 Tax=Shewanella sp. 10N.286.52.B9 TaxID=1880837 RepID=UPI000C81A3FE|nr:IS3 family transposase [Shewanella sp. 10N.286.52.B9]
MSLKKSHKSYPQAFKDEAVLMVLEQGYSVAEAAKSLGVSTSLLYNWKEKHQAQQQGIALEESERDELKRLRRENKELRMEKEIPKKGKRLLCERHEVKFRFIKQHSSLFPIALLSRVMNVSKSGYYDWHKRPVNVINLETLKLYRLVRQLFKQSRGSLGNREMVKKLRKEGYQVGRYLVRKIMYRLRLKATQRRAYKVTTQRKHSDAVADNLLNMNFNPVSANQIWAGDVTYLKTGEGWMYLAVVMDLYSRRIVEWHIDKRMTTDLISKALMKAYNLRQPARGLVFHSDRGSQYTSKQFGKLLSTYGIQASMGDVGACWDNAVVERFFGSLKHDWVFKVAQPTREFMKQDVAAYMKYYNLERLHSANGDLSPVEFENSQLKVSNLG